MSLTSDEVNLLVYRYLQESGFIHSAFSFGNESHIFRTASSNVSKDIQPGALINFLQKGLLYLEAETHLQEDGSELQCLEPFSLVTNHVCKYKSKTKKIEKDKKPEKEKSQAKRKPKKEPDTPELVMFSPDDVYSLEGHTNEVFVVAFNPQGTLLASASADSTARIWDVNSLGNPKTINNSILLDHSMSSDEKSKDVTSLEWSHNGLFIATGAYDGLVRIWSPKGALEKTLSQHAGPIFSVKWNITDQLILSASIDKTTIVWDAETGVAKQKFSYHTGPALDAVWRNANMFASCSTDKTVCIWELGNSSPVKVLQGHEDEVNMVAWDPSGTYLASCSDDRTAKIWTVKSTTPLFDFRGHEKEIFVIRWAPTGSGSKNPTMQPLLATGSYDMTVRLWEMEKGTCLLTFSRHSDAIYSLAFSPDGSQLVSGSFDGWLYFWSTKDGTINRAYKGGGGSFQLCWSDAGDKVASCFVNNVVCVLNLKPNQAPMQL